MAQDAEDIDDDLFTEALPDYLKCPICLCCLKEPYQTPCGHRYCKECIMPCLKSRQNLCPKDRTVIDTNNTFPDNAVRLQINSLKIKCPQHAAGCKWKGDLSDKHHHWQNCPYQEAPCPLCGAIVQKLHLDTHQKVCPRRQVPCDHCEELFSFSDLASHYATCPEFPVACRYSCTGDKIARKHIELHYEECLKFPVPCQMAEFGCTESVERGEMGTHLLQCAPLRTANLATRILGLQKEVQDLTLQLNQLKDTQGNAADTVYPCSGQFTWRIEDIHNKVEQAKSGDPLMSVIYSPPFFSGEAGYKLCLCIYPAGDNNQSYMSVYFVLMRGPYDEILPWPFQKRIHLSLLSCKSNAHILKDIQPDPHLHYFSRPENPRNVGYGYPKFISLQRLLADDSEFSKNGCIFLRCKILH